MPGTLAAEDQTPPNDEKELSGYVNRLYTAAVNAMRANVTKWQKFDRIFRGKQWTIAMEPWRAQIVNNVVASNIDTLLSIAVDVDARMTAMPVEGGDKAIADGLDEMFKYAMRKYEWSDLFELGFLTKLKFGTTLYKASWNPDCGPDGDAVISRVLPFNFIPDPSAKTLEECRYVFECKILTLAEIKRLHPEKGGQVTPDSGLREKSTEGAEDPNELIEVPAYDRDDPRYDERLDTDRRSKDDDFARALYVELWIQDETSETVTEEEEELEETTDEDGRTIFEVVTVKNKVEKLKYPGGRRICFSGNVILDDVPNPFWHQRFPYVVEYDNPDDMSFWGTGEVENLESLQKEFNKRKSQIADNANLMANPTWILDANSGVRPSAISNAPGKAIRKTPGSEVRRDNPPELPDYVLNSYETTRRDIQDISGVHEALSGRFSTGMDNYSAMRQAVDQAEVRPRKKIRHQLTALRKLARLMCALYMQYYPEERWRRILGNKAVDRMLEGREGAELKFELEEVYEMYDIFTETEVMTRNTRDLYRERIKELFGLMKGEPALVPAVLQSFQVEDREEILGRMGLTNPPAPLEPQAQPPAQLAAPPSMPPPPMNLPPDMGGTIPPGMPETSGVPF